MAKFNITVIRQMATPNDITVFKVYTLLPTCWIFTNTDFHIGLRSFFITSVLQIGICTPPSATFDINKKGSCKIRKKKYYSRVGTPHNAKKKKNTGAYIS